MTNGDLPIHPISNNDMPCRNVGLTKREYFAALAMQAMLTNEKLSGAHVLYGSNSVKFADALLEELERE